MDTLDHHRQRRFLIGLIIGSILIMTASALVDRDVTVALARHPWPALVDFMGRTLFEGQRPGANDSLVLLLIGALGVYAAGWGRPDSPRWSTFRPQAGFVLIAVLVVAFLLMHVIKLSQGRARPDLVLNHGWRFTPWFTVGPHFIGDGIFRGAFPSGHTAQAFSSMAFAYALYCDPFAGRRIRLLGAAWGFIVICLSLVMGMARCMSLSHWFSDVTGSICLGWIVIHTLYFDLLMVPAQRVYYHRHGRHLPMPACWELRLGAWLTVLALGLLVCFNAVRALWLGRTLWLAWLLPLGLAIVYSSGLKAIKLRRRLVSGLASPPRDA